MLAVASGVALVVLSGMIVLVAGTRTGPASLSVPITTNPVAPATPALTTPPAPPAPSPKPPPREVERAQRPERAQNRAPLDVVHGVLEGIFPRR